MSVRLAGGRLGGKSPLRQRPQRLPINPMESIVNLIDVMLIFACGLMVSLVALWGLNLDPNTNQDAYQDIGHVYVDPSSGRTFIVMPPEEGGGG